MPASLDSIILTITHLGGLGHGVAQWEGRPVYVPHTAAGDVVEVRILSSGKDFARAELLHILSPGPSRTAPPCLHFGQCGGCNLQHVDAASYAEFKTRILSASLARLGVPAETLQPIITVGYGARRRVEFAVRVEKGQVRLGFMEPGSHRLVPLSTCPVADTRLSELLPWFETTLSAWKKPSLITSLSMTQLKGGIDLLLTLSSMPSGADHARLLALLDHPSILRLNARIGESTTKLAQKAPATIRFGATEVELPPGSFLQATQRAQDAITQFLLRHTEGALHLADIYSGCGTYTLPLLDAGHRVEAYEGSADMVAALHNAIRHHHDGKGEAHLRDLFRQPLSPQELNKFDAVVINPPRNGALPQAQALASSAVTRVLMISCNPATFERDAACLLAAGFRVTEAVPIDQFHASPHLELAAAFSR